MRVKRRFPCVKCGYNKCVRAKHFHHVIKENKTFVNYLYKNTSNIKKIKEEIRKCVLLCANCHAEEHYNERINNT